MGILQPKQEDGPIRIEEVLDNEQAINYGDYVFDSDLEDFVEGNEDAEEVIAPRLGLGIAAGELRARRGQKKSSRGGKPRLDFDVTSDAPLQYRKNMGARKKQRLDNYRLIASFADPDDICYDARDLLEETITAFTRLLRDENGMRMWNEFIEKDEKEQRRILRRIDEETKISSSSPSPPNTNSAEGVAKEEQMRAHHPAYSAGACFSRMDKRFKKILLRGRNVPYEFIDKAEVRLREFFLEAPGAVYVEKLASRFKRFYLHATSQYLALKSRSMPSDGSGNGGGSANEKTIEIENSKDPFKPPDGSLVQFLMSRRRLKRGERELGDLGY